MPPDTDWLALDDSALLADCDLHIYKASGPGGQHRNKVSSAVRVHHRPTGLSAHGDDSRSQHENKRLAIKRLRMQIALQVRRNIDRTPPAELPEPIRSCLHAVKSSGKRVDEPGVTAAGKRLNVGRKDVRFWPVSQYVLDLLEAFESRLADAAGYLGVTTSNLVAHLKKDRHLFGAAQQMRKRFGESPLR